MKSWSMWPDTDMCFLLFSNIKSSTNYIFRMFNVNSTKLRITIINYTNYHQIWIRITNLIIEIMNIFLHELAFLSVTIKDDYILPNGFVLNTLSIKRNQTLSWWSNAPEMTKHHLISTTSFALLFSICHATSQIPTQEATFHWNERTSWRL